MKRVAIVGGGPAGLMAAEVLAEHGGCQVDLYEAMPSVGRKFLMAGKGGMNITHSEALPQFMARYAARQPDLAPMIEAFPPSALCEWIHGLGIETFVGSSGRVFPTEMKAAPLLRAWLHRLRERGVRIHVRHRWTGWNAAGDLSFTTPDGAVAVAVEATLLALGGASWAKLGSDGRWFETLARRGISIAPLLPANCGFEVGWSPYFRERFPGAPVKSVLARVESDWQAGEFNITEQGIEGGLIYALSAPLRDALIRDARAVLYLDLAPGRSRERLVQDLSRPRGRDSWSNHLRRCTGLSGVKAALLRECVPPERLDGPEGLAAAIKNLPLPIQATRPLDEAISTAGGVRFEGLDAHLMLRRQPGLFMAGEMLDWEAPTGGYLLTACLASGRWAGLGIAAYLAGVSAP